MAKENNALYKWIKNSKYTQAQVAEEIGIKPSGVTNHVHGGPVSSVCLKMYKIIGVPESTIEKLKIQGR